MKIAHGNGVTALKGNMGLSMSPMRGAARAVWARDGRGGTASGNVLLDIDAVSGAVLGKTTQR